MEPVKYVDLLNQRYRQQGFPPYRWTVNTDTTFTQMKKPLSECRVSMLTWGGVSHSSMPRWDAFAKNDFRLDVVDRNAGAADFSVNDSYYDTSDASIDINCYVIGSPWICWDNPLVFDYEAEYAAAHDNLDAVVFLAAGGAEHVLSPAFDPSAAEIFKIADTEAHTTRLGALLASRNYPNLRLKTLIFPEETHFTVSYALIPHGLRYVFQDG